MANIDLTRFDIIINELEEKIKVGKRVLEKQDIAFVAIFHCGGYYTGKYNDTELFLEKLGYDTKKIEGNIDKIYKNALDVLSKEINKYMHEHYNVNGYEFFLATGQIGIGKDVIILMKKKDTNK